MDTENGIADALHDKENLDYAQTVNKHALNSPFAVPKAKLRNENSTPLETPLGDKRKSLVCLSLAVGTAKSSRHKGTASKGILKDITNIVKTSSPSRLRNKLVPEADGIELKDEVDTIESKEETESGLESIFYNENGKLANAEYAPTCLKELDDFENELTSARTDLAILGKASMGPTFDCVEVERELPSCDEL